MLSCHYHKDCYLRSSLTCGLRFLLNITLNIWPQLVAVRPLVGSSGLFVWLLPTIFCSPALCLTIPHIQVFEAMCNNTSHPGIEAMCTYRYPIFPGVSRNMLATSAFARVRTEVLLQEEAYSSRCTTVQPPISFPKNWYVVSFVSPSPRLISRDPQCESLICHLLNGGTPWRRSLWLSLTPPLALCLLGAIESAA